MLEMLLKAYGADKKAEAIAKKRRLNCEKQIIKAVEESHELKFEGANNIIAGNLKLTLTTKVTRTLNYEAYQALELPENLQFVDLKPAINTTRMRAIEMVDPSLLDKCITIKPAKASIKIVEIDEEAE